MTGESGFMIGSDRLAPPPRRPWGGRACKMIRRADDRMGVSDANTGAPLGVVVSEADADLLDALRKPKDPDARRGRMATAAIAAFAGVLLLLWLLYAVWHHGRWFERQYGAERHESRFSVG